MNFEGELLLGFKIGALLVFGFYIIFALVVVRQVYKMTSTLAVGLEASLKFIAVLHFLLSVVVFGISLVIL